LDVAPNTENATTAQGRVSRFRPDDPEQVVYRSMLADLDEDQILCLETEIEQYQLSGILSRRLASLLHASKAA